jgi:hypothetical protein
VVSPKKALARSALRLVDLADRIVARQTLLALAAGHLERHDDAVADLQPLAGGLGAHLDNLAHRLMPHDVAGAHGRHEAVHQVQV